MLQHFRTRIVNRVNDYHPEFGADVPDHLRVDGGVAIVIGCHPDWEKELDEALNKYPDAILCPTNYAVNMVAGKYICSLHGEMLQEFAALHEDKWGYKPDALITRERKGFTPSQGETVLKVFTHGPSGTFAAAAMIALGYDLAIMCGSPVDGTGGYDNRAENQWPVDNWQNPDNRTVIGWQEGLKVFKDQYPEAAAKMRSMSGSTKRIFGGIDG